MPTSSWLTSGSNPSYTNPQGSSAGGTPRMPNNVPPLSPSTGPGGTGSSPTGNKPLTPTPPPAGSTPIRPTRSPVQVSGTPRTQGPSFWQRAGQAVERGWNSLPTATEAVGQAANAAFTGLNSYNNLTDRIWFGQMGLQGARSLGGAVAPWLSKIPGASSAASGISGAASKVAPWLSKIPGVSGLTSMIPAAQGMGSKFMGPAALKGGLALNGAVTLADTAREGFDRYVAGTAPGSKEYQNMYMHGNDPLFGSNGRQFETVDHPNATHFQKEIWNPIARAGNKVPGLPQVANYGGWALANYTMPGASILNFAESVPDVIMNSAKQLERGRNLDDYGKIMRTTKGLDNQFQSIAASGQSVPRAITNQATYNAKKEQEAAIRSRWYKPWLWGM